MLQSIKRKSSVHPTQRTAERKLPAVCILHGYGEGPLHSRQLRKILDNVGYRVTKDPREADIIVTHSGGSLIIPEDIEGKLILLIAPCNGYRGRSLLLTMLQKIGLDLRTHAKDQAIGAWLRKTSWNMVYILVNHSRHLRMLKNLRRSKDLPHLGAHQLGIILYRDDPWSWYFDRNDLMSKHQASFISHPRGHDDIWTHPEEYVAILQYLYETRFLAGPDQR